MILLYKNMLKSSAKTIGKIFLFISSLIVIGIVAGFIFFLLVEHNHKPCDERFIHGCMAAGLDEQTCKNRLY